MKFVTLLILLIVFAFISAKCNKICSKEYDPVCGKCKNGERRTFSNSCFAKCEKCKIVSKGECKSKKECICTKELRPVCANCHGRRQTFGNPCLAKCAKCKVISNGECVSKKRPKKGPKKGSKKCTRSKKKPKENCICPALFKPVCAKIKGVKKTFGNACAAACENAVFVHEGECKKK